MLRSHDFNKKENHPLCLWIAAGQHGIYTLTFYPESTEPKNGPVYHLTNITETAPLHVTYLVKHPDELVIYAILRGDNFSQIHAYQMSDDGDLQLINTINDCPAGAAHLSINAEGSLIAVAYYLSGQTGIYTIQPSGALGTIRHEIRHSGSSLHPKRQTSPHPHWTGFSLNSDCFYVTDLGIDQILCYHVNNNQLNLQQQICSTPGAGPRHMAFHPSLDIVYVTHELRPGISRYQCDPVTGKLNYQEVIDSLTGQKQMPEQTYSEIYNASDLKIHPSGHFLYVLNRGVAVISVFSIHQETGKLKLIASEPAYTPSCRNITFTSDGRWMFITGEFSHSVIIFEINPDDGELTWIPLIAEVPGAMLVLTHQA